MIKLSKKGSYALKSVIFIASENKLLKVKDISLNQNISISMLRRIIADLEKSGILITIKGRNGGVKIGKNLSQISVFDILLSIGENLGISNCSTGLICSNVGECLTSNLVQNLQKGFNSLLKINTIDKLIK